MSSRHLILKVTASASLIPLSVMARKYLRAKTGTSVSSTQMVVLSHGSKRLPSGIIVTQSFATSTKLWSEVMLGELVEGLNVRAIAHLGDTNWKIVVTSPWISDNTFVPTVRLQADVQGKKAEVTTAMYGITDEITCARKAEAMVQTVKRELSL